MPGANGLQLGQRLEGLYPHLPIFLMTSYSGRARDEAEAHGWLMFDKPLDFPTVLAAIRQRIAQPVSRRGKSNPGS